MALVSTHPTIVSLISEWTWPPLTVRLLRAGPMAVTLVNLLLVSACVQAAVAMLDRSLDLHWELWKKTHNKNYQDEVWGLLTVATDLFSSVQLRSHTISPSLSRMSRWAAGNCGRRTWGSSTHTTWRPQWDSTLTSWAWITWGTWWVNIGPAGFISKALIFTTNVKWMEMRSMMSVNFVIYISWAVVFFSEGIKKKTGVAMQIEESIL